MIRGSLSRLRRSALLPGAVGGLCVAAVLAGPSAWAAITANPSASTTYTGCLGTSSGSIYNVKQGGKSLATCTGKDKQIKLSAGDITSVTAGTGLTGGAAKGDASLALSPSDTLPQSCPLDTSPTPSGTGTWQCGTEQSHQFAYLLHTSSSQTVPFYDFALRLGCGTSQTELDAVNPDDGISGTFNALVAPLNGTATDVGFGVPASGTTPIAINTGGTATFVYAGGGGMVTGTVSWYLEGEDGSCQFDGSMLYSSF